MTDTKNEGPAVEKAIEWSEPGTGAVRHLRKAWGPGMPGPSSPEAYPATDEDLRNAGYVPASVLEAARAELATERKGIRHLEEAAELLRRRPTVTDGIQGLYDWMQDVEAWKSRDRAECDEPLGGAEARATPGGTETVGACPRCRGGKTGPWSCRDRWHTEPAPVAEAEGRVTHDHGGAGGGDEDGYNMVLAAGGGTHRDVRNYFHRLSPDYLGKPIMDTLLAYVDKAEQSEREAVELRKELENARAEGSSEAVALATEREGRRRAESQLFALQEEADNLANMTDEHTRRHYDAVRAATLSGKAMFQGDGDITKHPAEEATKLPTTRVYGGEAMAVEGDPITAQELCDVSNERHRWRQKAEAAEREAVELRKALETLSTLNEETRVEMMAKLSEAERKLAIETDTLRLVESWLTALGGCTGCGSRNCSELWAYQKKCCPDCSHGGEPARPDWKGPAMGPAKPAQHGYCGACNKLSCICEPAEPAQQADQKPAQAEQKEPGERDDNPAGERGDFRVK